MTHDEWLNDLAKRLTKVKIELQNYGAPASIVSRTDDMLGALEWLKNNSKR